jgi:hypothetical protein
MDNDQQILGVGDNDELLFPRPQAQQFQFILHASAWMSKLRPGGGDSDARKGAKQAVPAGGNTSVSKSCTRTPAAPTKFHTTAASSCTACSWFDGPTAPASPEKDPGVVAGWADAVAPKGLFLRINATWPLVFRIAPDVRSRTMVALTPSFLERRPSVSSKASGPVPYMRRC